MHHTICQPGRGWPDRGVSIPLVAWRGRRKSALANYFFRNRSNRTTSAPSPGFVGSSAFGEAAAAGGGTATDEEAGAAGRFFAGASGAASAGSNCNPNCTEGSKKLLMAANGTTKRSGMPPNDKPTSKRSSVTTRSQNWCCKMIVISSGYCARSREDSFTPSAVERKVMKK